MKVVPINYLDDIEKLIRESKDDEPYVGIEKMSITYTQPDDMSSNETQEITLTTECQCSVGIDDDAFYVKIKTGENSWAIYSAEDLKALIDDFQKRLYIGKEYLKSKENETDKSKE